MHRPLLTIGLTLMATSAFAAPDFFISSPAFDKDLKTLPPEQIGNQPGCNGPNQSPAVSWKDLPKGTKSVAVTLFDQDANKGSGLWHWVVFNIPPTAGGLPANAGAAEDMASSGTMPVGAQMGKNDKGDYAYIGACPPVGERDHRYILTVWALAIDALPEEAGLSGTAFKGYLDKYSLGSKNLSAKYGRK